MAARSYHSILISSFLFLDFPPVEFFHFLASLSPTIFKDLNATWITNFCFPDPCSFIVLTIVFSFSFTPNYLLHLRGIITFLRLKWLKTMQEPLKNLTTCCHVARWWHYANILVFSLILSSVSHYLIKQSMKLFCISKYICHHFLHWELNLEFWRESVRWMLTDHVMNLDSYRLSFVLQFFFYSPSHVSACYSDLRGNIQANNRERSASTWLKC